MNDVFGALAHPIIDRPGMPRQEIRVAQSEKAKPEGRRHVLSNETAEDRRNRRERCTRKFKGHVPNFQTPWNLTTAQIACISACADGLSNQGAAKKLGVGVKTIEKHLQNAFAAMSLIEGASINRVRAAVLLDRFMRGCPTTDQKQ